MQLGELRSPYYITVDPLYEMQLGELRSPYYIRTGIRWAAYSVPARSHPIGDPIPVTLS